jgi:hypothetical protein
MVGWGRIRATWTLVLMFLGRLNWLVQSPIVSFDKTAAADPNPALSGCTTCTKTACWLGLRRSGIPHQQLTLSAPHILPARHPGQAKGIGLQSYGKYANSWA